MSKDRIVRAWKDPVFRASLSPEERAQLPAHPAGEAMVELEENELAMVVGGNTSNSNCQCYSDAGSCGWICTFTTECPFLSICC